MGKYYLLEAQQGLGGGLATGLPPPALRCESYSKGGPRVLAAGGLGEERGSLPFESVCSFFVLLLLHSQVASWQRNSAVSMLGVSPCKVSQTRLEEVT